MASGNGFLIPKFEFELESLNRLSSCALGARRFDLVPWYPNSNLIFREPAHYLWIGLPLKLWVESISHYDHASLY